MTSPISSMTAETYSGEWNLFFDTSSWVFRYQHCNRQFYL